ncbi:MAG: cupin domain-containing protein, partial [Acidimicrobiia bacterium]|nr:cupin domain-containing protein [Acidimicrobiia bacterium]
MATRRFRADAPELDAFYERLAGADLQPLWLQENLMPLAPPRDAWLHRWPAAEYRELAARSGALVSVERGGDRRVLGLCNPGLGGLPYATPTLWAGVQFLNGGELAPAHRHSPNALRFVLEGRGTWTTVDADPVAMEPGDLVLTPSWAWHSHVNVADEPMLWFDGLDIPLALSLDAVFFEPGPDERPRPGEGRAPGELAFGTSPGLVPNRDRPAAPHSPLVRYPWEATDRALDALLAAEGGAGPADLRFVDPTTGRDVTPTMRCTMMRLVPGTALSHDRVPGSAVRVVFRGSGTVDLQGRREAYGPGDVIAIPSWSECRLEA